MRRPLVQQRQGAADRRVAQARQPAGLASRQRVQIAAHDLDEHQLAQPQANALAAGAAASAPPPA